MDPEHPSTPSPVESAPDLTLLGDIEVDLADVERALARLDEGTYGICQTCGSTIDPDRLAAHPATAHCSQHAAS